MYDCNAIIYYIILFIISVIVTWIALSLLLIWISPSLFNTDGSLNWWTTLWISAVLIIFVWIICLILVWIIRLFSDGARCNTSCNNPCEKKVVNDECDPCQKVKVTNPNSVQMPVPLGFFPSNGVI